MNVTAGDTFYYSKLSQLGVEEWLPIKGFDFAYEVSNIGRVRSIPRSVSNHPGSSSARCGRILKGRCSPKDNHRPGIDLYKECTRFNRRVHSLVAEAFIGPRPEDLVVCHNNGNPQDNRLFNLRYDTQLNNMQDSIRHGTAAKLNPDGTPKGALRRLFSDEEVENILYVLATEDLFYKEAEVKYGWPTDALRQIDLKESYQWVKEPEIPSHLPRYSRKDRMVYKNGEVWRTVNSTLNADRVRDIREQAEAGVSWKQLAIDFNITVTTVRAITLGRYCSWAPGPLRKKCGQ